MLICSTAFVLVFISSEIHLIYPPSNQFCYAQSRIMVVTYGLALFCAYFVLWFRVCTVYYRNDAMKKYVGRFLDYINVTAMPLLSFIAIGNIATVLSEPGYTAVGCACALAKGNENNDNPRPTIYWSILTVCAILFQSAIFFCFIYPLYLHRKKMLNNGHDQEFMMPIVKRVAVVASVCVISDLLNFTFVLTYKSVTVYMDYIVYGSNLLVNVIGTIASFGNWREKLLPFDSILKSISSKQTDSNESDTSIVVTNASPV